MNVLRWLLVMLVLLNLAFVQLTGAARPAWLLPLYGLTLAAPFLSRLTTRVSYRLLWNVTILLIFGLLMRSGISDGIAHLLEYGMLLAAFCQVHLVNNLRDGQRPDLLFFNSFLIAVVTGFFCQDVAFSLVFVCFVFVLLAAMQVAAAPRLSDSAATALLWRSTRISAVVLSMTIAAFFVWPRDFHRRGLIDQELAIASGLVRRSGFSEQVQIGGSSSMVQSTKVVFRATVEHGDQQRVPRHWRGATFVRYDERGWQATQQLQRRQVDLLDPPFVIRRPGYWMRTTGHDVRLTVDVFEPQRRLFTPLSAVHVDLQDIQVRSAVMPLLDGTFRYEGRDQAQNGEPAFRYDLRLSTPHSEPEGPVPVQVKGSLLAHVYAAPHLIPPQVVALLKRFTTGLASDTPQHEVVEQIRSKLSSTFHYLLPGEEGAAATLVQFLSGAGGHCEYFATTLALLLRQRGIPCRLVSGFLVHEWSGTTATVRERDAHAWVEVFDPAGFWYAADATPAQVSTEGSDGWWRNLTGTASQWWQHLTGFDGDARAGLMASLARLPKALFDHLLARPIHGALGLLLLIGLFLFGRRLRLIRKRRPLVILDYEAAVTGTGIARAPAETPTAFLQRVATLDVKPSRLERLAEATAAHQAFRYGTAALKT